MSYKGTKFKVKFYNSRGLSERLKKERYLNIFLNQNNYNIDDIFIGVDKINNLNLILNIQSGEGFDLTDKFYSTELSDNFSEELIDDLEKINLQFNEICNNHFLNILHKYESIIKQCFSLENDNEIRNNSQYREFIEEFRKEMFKYNYTEPLNLLVCDLKEDEFAYSQDFIDQCLEWLRDDCIFEEDLPEGFKGECSISLLGESFNVEFEVLCNEHS